MAGKLVVSVLQGAWSILQTTGGVITATRIAMTANAPMLPIMVKALFPTGVAQATCLCRAATCRTERQGYSGRVSAGSKSLLQTSVRQVAGRNGLVARSTQCFMK